MFSLINKLKVVQPISNFGKHHLKQSSLTYAPKRYSTEAVSSLGITENVEEKKIIDDMVQKLSLDDLVTERVSIDQLMSNRELEREQQLIALQLNGDITEYNRVVKEREEEIYGANFERIYNTRLVLGVDAIKSGIIDEPLDLTYHNRLDQYNFHDSVNDYQVLDRTIPSKSLTRLSGIHYANAYAKSQFSGVVENEDDHYSRFLDPLEQEDYLTGKPDNYIMVQNMGPKASIHELYVLFAEYGKIEKFNMRYDSLERPAFFEVMYENPIDAVKAKNEMHGQRYADRTIYVKNNRDAEYERPENRTVVYRGLPRDMQFEQVVNLVSQAGNIMELSVIFEERPNALPTKEQMIKHINENLQDERHRQHITLDVEHFYPSSVTIKEKIMNNSFDYVEGENQKRASIVDADSEDAAYDAATNIYREEKRLYQKYFEIFQDLPKKLTFGVLNENGVAVREQPNYLFRNLKQAHSAPTAKELFNDLVSEQQDKGDIFETVTKELEDYNNPIEQKIITNNLIEKPSTVNRGYCFVVYPSTDQAKRAIIESEGRDEGLDIRAYLKNHTDHIDHDEDYFLEQYLRYRNKVADGIELKNLILRKDVNAGASRNNALTNEQIFGDNAHDIFKKHEVRKKYPEALKMPEEVKQDMLEEDYQKEQFIRSYAEEHVMQAAKGDIHKKILPEIEKLDEVVPDVGRTFNTQITENDYENFVRRIKSRDSHQEQLLKDTLRGDEGFYETIHDAFYSKNQVNETSTGRSARLLEEFNERFSAVDNINMDLYMTDLKNVKQLNDIVNKGNKTIPKFKGILAGKKFKEVDEINARKEDEDDDDDDGYYDPFTRTLPGSQTIDKTQYSNLQEKREAYYLNGQNRFRKNINTALTQDYDVKELEHIVDKSFAEWKKDPYYPKYYHEVDSEGYQFITEADVERITYDFAPGDPYEKDIYLKKFRERRFRKIYKEKLLRRSTVNQDLATILLTTGIPVNSYAFEPTEQYETPQQLADELNAMDNLYSYDAAKDYRNKDIIVRSIKKKYKYDVNFYEGDNFDKLVEEYNQKLEENEIPKDYSNGTLIRENPQLYHEYQEKAHAILKEMVPPHIYESLLNPDNPEIIAQEHQVQRQIENVRYKYRALQKKDFVKFKERQYKVKTSKGQKPTEYTVYPGF